MPLVLRAKCVLVGDSTVGKSALTQAFASDGTHIPKAYTMTTGVDVCVKSVQMQKSEDTVELYIYDCAGKEIFYDYVQQFWDDPSVIMIMYDVTNKESFDSCANWFKRVVARKSSPDVFLPGALVANKVDIEDQRVVDMKMGQGFAANNSLDYFESSINHHENYMFPFHSLAEKFYQHYQEKIKAFKALT